MGVMAKAWPKTRQNIVINEEINVFLVVNQQ
jgi:hypothetical protein